MRRALATSGNALGSSAHALGKHQAFRHHQPVKPENQIDRELGAAAIAGLADMEAAREQRIENRRDLFRGTPRSPPISADAAAPCRTCSLDPDTGVSSSRNPSRATRAAAPRCGPDRRCSSPARPARSAAATAGTMPFSPRPRSGRCRTPPADDRVGAAREIGDASRQPRRRPAPAPALAGRINVMANHRVAGRHQPVRHAHCRSAARPATPTVWEPLPTCRTALPIRLDRRRRRCPRRAQERRNWGRARAHVGAMRRRGFR